MTRQSVGKAEYPRLGLFALTISLIFATGLAAFAAGETPEELKQDSGVRFNETIGAGSVGEQPSVWAEMGLQEKPNLAAAGNGAPKGKEKGKKKGNAPPSPNAPMTYETDDDVRGINTMITWLGLGLLGAALGVAAGGAGAIATGMTVGNVLASHFNTVTGVLGGLFTTVISGWILVPTIGHGGAKLFGKMGEWLANRQYK